MSDVRELRLALKQKLEERRKLLSQNDHLREINHSLNRRNQDLNDRNRFLEHVISSPLANMEMERMADEIVNEILEKAIQASETIAREKPDSGGYVVGIDVPNFRIQRFICDFEDRLSRHPGRANESREMFFTRIDHKIT